MYNPTLEFPPFFQNRPLQDVLGQQSLTMRIALEKEVHDLIDGQKDEEAYIASVIEKFSAKIPQFNFDPKCIQKVDKYEQMDGSHFVGEVIFTDRMYNAWVVTFGIPYKGNLDYLRSGTSIGGTPELTYDNQFVYFRAWTLDGPNKNIQKIAAKRDEVIVFLQNKLANITPELEEFNQALVREVPALVESLKIKYQKDKDALANL
jgi:hypothetical protein